MKRPGLLLCLIIFLLAVAGILAYISTTTPRISTKAKLVQETNFGLHDSIHSLTPVNGAVPKGILNEMTYNI